MKETAPPFKSDTTLPDVCATSSKFAAHKNEDEFFALKALVGDTAIRADRFSTVPALLLSQAQRIEVWQIPLAKEEAQERLGLSGESEESHLLLLGKDTKSASVVDGCEVVAYPCDSVGKVKSWARRYNFQDLNFNIAAQKLRYLIINGLCELQTVENF